MSNIDIVDEFKRMLPDECKIDLETGVAMIKFKLNSFCIIDTEEEGLFDCLPLIPTKYGFCISIPYKGKSFNTHFAEVVCRKKGKVEFKNNFYNDLRKTNLNIIPWDSYTKDHDRASGKKSPRKYRWTTSI